MVLLNAAYDAGLGYRGAVLCLIALSLWNGASLLFLGRYRYSDA